MKTNQTSENSSIDQSLYKLSKSWGLIFLKIEIWQLSQVFIVFAGIFNELIYFLIRQDFIF